MNPPTLAALFPWPVVLLSQKLVTTGVIIPGRGVKSNYLIADLREINAWVGVLYVWLIGTLRVSGV